MIIRYDTGRSTASEIAAHLAAADSAFHPPLSHRINLTEYAEKLARHAQRTEAWDGKVLIGLVAVYCNDPSRATAFVSSVSVLDRYGRRGIARHLMQQAIAQAQDLGFGSLALEVNNTAVAALSLYQSLGFLAAASDAPDAPDALRLELPLGPRAEATI